MMNTQSVRLQTSGDCQWSSLAFGSGLTHSKGGILRLVVRAAAEGLGFAVELSGAARWRWLAALPSALGFAVALRCMGDFGWTGHGPPAPFVPPQRLVVVGFYR